MKIQVRVNTNSPEQEIEDFGDRRYLVKVKSAPENNKANIELINLLARHLGVPALKLKIVSGLSSRDKTLEIVY